MSNANSIMEVIRARHSVRSYNGKPLSEQERDGLERVIDACRDESGLNIQLVTGNPEVFNLAGGLGFVKGADAHIAFVTEGRAQDEAVGFWGQRIVLEAQRMGLNTCWVAFIARKKSRAVVPAGKTLRIGIAVGWGTTAGKPRKTKPVSALSRVENGEAPAWFALGVEAAQLAPTAMNNQHFLITLLADGCTVRAEATKNGSWDAIDLGIVKRNFEEAANSTGADWCWETTPAQS